jgi:hypothetical protein
MSLLLFSPVERCKNTLDFCDRYDPTPVRSRSRPTQKHNCHRHGSPSVLRNETHQCPCPEQTDANRPDTIHSTTGSDCPQHSVSINLRQLSSAHFSPVCHSGLFDDLHSPRHFAERFDCRSPIRTSFGSSLVRVQSKKALPTRFCSRSRSSALVRFGRPQTLRFTPLSICSVLLVRLEPGDVVVRSLSIFCRSLSIPVGPRLGLVRHSNVQVYQFKVCFVSLATFLGVVIRISFNRSAFVSITIDFRHNLVIPFKVFSFFFRSYHFDIASSSHPATVQTCLSIIQFKNKSDDVLFLD